MNDSWVAQLELPHQGLGSSVSSMWKQMDKKWTMKRKLVYVGVIQGFKGVNLSLNTLDLHYCK